MPREIASWKLGRPDCEARPLRPGHPRKTTHAPRRSLVPVVPQEHLPPGSVSDDLLLYSSVRCTQAFRMSNLLSPRSLLAPWSPAQQAHGSTSVPGAKNVQSRLGRHATYQRHASSMNRILPQAFGCLLSSFPQFPRARNTTPVTLHPPKGRSEIFILFQKLYRTPASIRRPLSAAYGIPKSGDPSTPPTCVTFVWFSRFDDRTFTVSACG